MKTVFLKRLSRHPKTGNRYASETEVWARESRVGDENGRRSLRGRQEGNMR